MTLPTTTSESLGSQSNTQSPQISTGSAGFPATAPAGSVQPGTAATLLKGSGGVPLSSVTLPTASLTATTTSTTQVQPEKTTGISHHPNPVLIVLVVILFILAAIFFWTTSHSAKNTTN